MNNKCVLDEDDEREREHDNDLQLGALAALAEEPGSVPRTHMVEHSCL